MTEFLSNYPVWITALLTLFAGIKAITILTPSTSDDKIVNFILKLLNIFAGNVGNDKNADDK